MREPWLEQDHLEGALSPGGDWKLRPHLRHSGVAGFRLVAGVGKQLGVRPAQRVIFGQVMAMPPLVRFFVVVVLAFTMIVAIIVILIDNVIVVFVIAPSSCSRYTPLLDAAAQAE